MLDDTPIFDIQVLQFIHTCGHVIPYLNEITYLKQFFLVPGQFMQSLTSFEEVWYHGREQVSLYPTYNVQWL